MAKAITVLARSKDVTGTVKAVETDVPLKNLVSIHRGYPSHSLNVNKTTVCKLDDGTEIVALHSKHEVFDAIRRVATSGKNVSLVQDTAEAAIADLIGTNIVDDPNDE